MSSLVTCTIHIFAVCVAVRTVIERGVHHQTHDAVDNELLPFGAALLCSREQSIIAGVEDSLGSSQSG